MSDDDELKSSPVKTTTRIANAHERDQQPSSVSSLDESSQRSYVKACLPAPAFAYLSCCETCRTSVGGIQLMNRHHCRNCGGTFCADCSNQFIEVPYEEYTYRGPQRTCSSCYKKIAEFFSQTHERRDVTWSGLDPVDTDTFLCAFQLNNTHNDDDHSAEDPSQHPDAPVVIYSCCYFPDHLPYYGHLYLTERAIFFLSYDASSLARLPTAGHDHRLSDPSHHRLELSFDEIGSMIKPDLYFLNALQVYARVNEKYFFMFLNGQREDCYMRLDQLCLNFKRQTQVRGITQHIQSNELQRREKGAQRRMSALGMGPDVPVSDLLSDKSLLPEPDAAVANMNMLLDIDLEMTVSEALDFLWKDVEFYRQYMEHLEDIDIDIGAWHAIEDLETSDLTTYHFNNDRLFKCSTESFSHGRLVSAKHPPQVTFPGLPPYAAYHRLQRYRIETPDRLLISDLQRMKSIPFADAFELETRWVFTRDGRNLSRIEVGLQVNFIQSTWFKGQISNSAISESKKALEVWAAHAQAQLLKIKKGQQQQTSVSPKAPATAAAATRAEEEPDTPLPARPSLSKPFVPSGWPVIPISAQFLIVLTLGMIFSGLWMIRGLGHQLTIVQEQLVHMNQVVEQLGEELTRQCRV